VTFKELLSASNPKVAAEWNRDKTKTLVYSMQYGAGKKRVMNAFGVDEETATTIIETYRATFPRFQMLNRNITLQAEAEGQVRTWSGRIRHLAYESDSYKAMNSVIQGGSADIVERVMVRLWKELDDDEKCRILLTVHDSVVFEIREDLVDEYIPRIAAIMSDVDAVTAPDSFGVKFAVDVEKWKYTTAA
jgi:DNA polymerase-1